ncbi:DUF4328 domain-containing protein [Phytoactinopolyspora halotolerans]|uniref:DUF4328 domain-containing protein n=1 Tax=Phytoactinopolyspora halotolerans TaxID=1981512 RepID=A0A6L9S574_9ACTN|nr:DUF4328 domain-containing protein [Phytoactinopolyspora halotolerans]NED99793.1 DUF4328 domain-containing protein [Phytoactinopolyspora halotolerans]
MDEYRAGGTWGMADGPGAQYQWPHHPPAPNLRRYSLRGLVTALTTLLVIAVVVDLAAAGSMFNRALLLDDAVAGAFIDERTGKRADDLVAGLGFAQLGMIVVIAVLFIIWQFRHAKNAQFLGSRRKLGPGWAIGGWFVPVANLFLPAMQLFGASRFSDPAQNHGRPHGAGAGAGAGIVVVWAVVFGLANTLSRATRIVPDQSDIDEYLRQAATLDRIVAASDALSAAAAVLALVMVRELSRRQELALDRAGSPQPAVGLPVSPSRATWGPPPRPRTAQPRAAGEPQVARPDPGTDGGSPAFPPPR